MALCDGQQITMPRSAAHPAGSRGGDAHDRGGNGKWPLQEYLDRVEKEAILEALEKTRYNRTAAAKLLGITFRAMRYRMERLGIN